MGYLKNYIFTAMDRLRSDYGIVSDIHKSADDRLVIVFVDNPGNVGERLSIANVLRIITNMRLVNLVAAESAWGGELDGGILRSIPDIVKESALMNMMQKLQLSPVEFCHAVSVEPFTLFGPEDHEIWEKSRNIWIETSPIREYFNSLVENNGSVTERDINELPETLKNYIPKMNEYSKLLEKRASIILSNLVQKMNSMELETSVFVGTHALVDRICNKMANQQLSYLVIKPHTLTKHNQNLYEKVLRGEPLNKIMPGSREEEICEQCGHRSGWIEKLMENKELEYKEPMCRLECELNDSTV